LLVLIYGSVGLAFRQLEDGAMPMIPDNADSDFVDRILCQLFAPAFAHLFDDPSRSVESTRSVATKIEAGTLGLMRATLLWKDASRVSKGAGTGVAARP
jgi:hypothetical protein